VKSIEEVFGAKEKKKEVQRKKKELGKEAGPSDQKTNSFTPLESPLHLYWGNRQHHLPIPACRQAGRAESKLCLF
jgi:hypothetical protein